MHGHPGILPPPHEAPPHPLVPRDGPEHHTREKLHFKTPSYRASMRQQGFGKGLVPQEVLQLTRHPLLCRDSSP